MLIAPPIVVLVVTLPVWLPKAVIAPRMWIFARVNGSEGLVRAETLAAQCASRVLADCPRWVRLRDLMMPIWAPEALEEPSRDHRHIRDMAASKCLGGNHIPEMAAIFAWPGECVWLRALR
jgi:hypothetical protein